MGGGGVGKKLDVACHVHVWLVLLRLGLRQQVRCSLEFGNKRPERF